MFKITVKGIWSRKGRLVLTSLAIIAGTAFLSGVFIFSDTIRKSFDTLFETAFENTDAYVRSANTLELDFGDDQRQTIPDTVVAQVQALPGVQTAAPDIQGFARISTMEGKELGTDNGPPHFGAVWDDTDLSSWTIAEGSPPTSPDQVVIDRGSAKQGKVNVGDQVKISATGPARTFTVSGIATFGDGKDSSGPTTWALFTLPTAEEFVLGEAGKISGVTVGCDGCSQEELATSIGQELNDPELEVVTGKTITEENQDSVATFLDFFTTLLTIFALISLFVGSFIIYNVFSISAAQRQRENALFRAIGASRRQVTRSLLVEALVVGIGGSLVGFLGGFGLASVILPLLDADDVSLVVSPSAFLITLVVGVLVTLVCAIAPALRAGRVPPLAAMRDVAVDRADVSRKRLVIGIVFVVIAIAAIIGGLTGSPAFLGVGVFAMFVALVVLGPLFAGPAAKLLTIPLGKARGVTGEIAGRNAARSPKRTALTAGALAVGLALVVGISTMATSIKASVRESVGSLFLGDFTISTADQGGGFGGLATTLPGEIAALPDVEGAVGLGFGNPMQLVEDGKPETKLPLTVDAAQAAKTLDLDFLSGGWDQLTGDGILLSKDKADDDGLTMGSTIEARYLNGSSKTVTVQGIYDNDDFGNIVVDQEFFAGSGQTQFFDQVVLVATSPGADEANVKADIEQVLENYPTGKLQTRSEFIDEQTKSIDQFLVLIYGLLAMSIFIAVLGIVITLLLAVYERRRELGLMRAIGMTRRQVRGSIRWEAGITAAIGVAMGVALGLALGWIVVKALADEGLNTFALSITTVLVAAIGAVVLGLLAAIWPAQRAAKADILEAIATT